MIRKIVLFISLLFCCTNAYGACPSAYPNNIPNTDICYLITAPGEYVAAPGAGAAPCPIGDYCPGGEKIYDIKIPERYTPVEYLENNATAYIDTGHIPTPATTVNTEAIITGGTNPTQWITFFGAQADTNAHRYASGIVPSTRALSFDYFTGYIGYSAAGDNLLNKRFNLKTQILDNRIYVLINNIDAGSVPIVPAPDFQHGIYLFAMANDWRPRHAYGRFYYYQARESDELVQYMIPVYDTESKLYGMYDIATNKFFGSANDDKFTGGPAIEPTSFPDLPTSGTYETEWGRKGCPSGSYCPAGSAAPIPCPSGYPNSDKGAGAITSCHSNSKSRAWTGSQTACTGPANSYSHTCNTCSNATCSYVAYSNSAGNGDGTIKSGCSSNAAACTQSVASFTCKAGYYKNGSSCSACSGLASGFYPNSDNGNSSGAGACRTNSLSGQYVATANATGATNCGTGKYKSAHQVAYGSASSCDTCPAGLTTIGYSAGADEAADCGHILHVGNDKVYLRSVKKTSPALHVKVDGTVYYGNMSTETKGKVRVKIGDTTYSVYDDSM